MPVTCAPSIVRSVASAKISPARVASPTLSTVVRTVVASLLWLVKRDETRRPWVCVIAPPRANSTIEEFAPAALRIAASALALFKMMLPLVRPAASSMRLLPPVVPVV